MLTVCQGASAHRNDRMDKQKSGTGPVAISSTEKSDRSRIQDVQKSILVPSNFCYSSLVLHSTLHKLLDFQSKLSYSALIFHEQTTIDQYVSKFPVLSYVLSQIDPSTHPSLPPETHLNLMTQFPHLANPKVLSLLSQSIPITVTQTLFLLCSLGPRLDPAAVSAAQSKIALMLSPEQAEIYKAVVRLEEMHEGYEKQLGEVEEKLSRVYGSIVEEVGREDGEVNEEVVGILKEAERRVVERVELSGRQLRFLPEAFGKLLGLISLNLSHNEE